MKVNMKEMRNLLHMQAAKHRLWCEARSVATWRVKFFPRREPEFVTETIFMRQKRIRERRKFATMGACVMDREAICQAPWQRIFRNRNLFSSWASS
jgi:hypothetical protein